MSIVYKYHNSLYVNLTNSCTMACTYCIKYRWKGKFRGHNLSLAKEPTAKQVIRAIGNPKKYEEIVFCGYGEPLLQLEQLKEIAGWVKSRDGRTRINTSGHANLVYGRNIAPELKGIVDAVSISLNASNPAQYVKLHKPKFGRKAFYAAINFAKECKKYIGDVTITTINIPGIDLNKCRRIASRIKVKFKVRPYL